MDPISDHPDTEIQPADLIERITTDRFQSWYRAREFRENIEEGQPYFNGPSASKPADQHSPSSLLQCHRKTTYRQLNAPEEQGDPEGIFWFGTRFEEELALPFLRDSVTMNNTYACNTLWVDFTVDTSVGPLRIKGATDPVIVDWESRPILITEIKTKSSVGHVKSPNKHHKAQAHAYMYGLTEKYDRKLTDAIILYGSREKLDVKPFHVEFDPNFWNDIVIEWASEHTEYRLNNELPPSDPEFDWECEFCSFRHRCGTADTPYSDTGIVGFLPLYSEYPKSKVVEYLKAQDGAKLTPTLAYRFPELTEMYDVFEWRCSSCRTSYEWNTVEWDPDDQDPPLCPSCRTDGELSFLSGPNPDKQHAPPETKGNDE